MARPQVQTSHEQRWVDKRAPARPQRKASAPSPEREPWRVFEDSLAVRFISRRRQTWDIHTLPDLLKNDVLSALEARDSIRQRYFELESAVRDLLAETARVSGSTSHEVARREQRIAALRAAAAAGGPLAGQAVFLIPFAERMDLIAQTLDLVVHGFLEVRESWSGNVTFCFKLGRAKSSCEAAELRREATSLNALAAIALPHLKLISKDMKCENI